MREIKFRAWVKNEYDGDDIAEYMEEDASCFQDPFEDHEDGNVILMQYIGLKDKNGVEIYEGDIIEGTAYSVTHKAIVRFGEYKQDGSEGEYNSVACIGFYADAIDPNELDKSGHRKIEKYDETTSLLYFDELKVIGNIYENPELISQ